MQTDSGAKILKEDEGLDLRPREDRDAQGNIVGLVIGHGHNFVVNPLTNEDLSHILIVDEKGADWLLWHDRIKKAQQLTNVGVHLDDHKPIVSTVIECCAYVMGAQGFVDHMKYRNTWQAFLNKDYKAVAAGLRQSKTYQQTGRIRFERYARMLERQEYVSREEIR